MLLQRNERGDLVPIQCASKKFSQTETRYGITEKGMFVVFWGILNTN